MWQACRQQILNTFGACVMLTVYDVQHAQRAPGNLLVYWRRKFGINAGGFSTLGY
jgi:hypothetical protein